MMHHFKWNVDGTLTFLCVCGVRESADRLRWKAPGGEWQETVTPPCAGEEKTG